jgi:outer membrane protein TolC
MAAIVNSIKKYIIFCGLLSSTNFLWAIDTTKDFDLKMILKFAVENAPHLRAAQSGIEGQNLAAKNAFYSMLPDLRLSASQGLSRSFLDGGPGSSWPTVAGLSLEQAILSKSANHAHYKKEKSALEVLKAKQHEAREILARDLSKNYYQVVLAHKQLELKQAKHDAVKVELGRVSALHRQGLKKRVDQIRLEAQLERENIQVIQSIRALAHQENNLKLGMGLAISDPNFDRIKFIMEEPHEQKVALLAKNRPTLSNNKTALRLSVEQIANQAEIKLSDYLTFPELKLGAFVNYHRAGMDLSSGLVPLPGHNMVAGLQLSLSFDQFIWGQSARSQGIIRHSVNAKNYLLSTEQLNVEKESSDLMATLSEQRKSFELSKKLLALENENYTYLSGEYHRGKIQYLDLMASLNGVFSAKEGYFSSYYNLIIALMNFHYLEGYLYEKILS